VLARLAVQAVDVALLAIIYNRPASRAISGTLAFVAATATAFLAVVVIEGGVTDSPSSIGSTSRSVAWSCRPSRTTPSKPLKPPRSTLRRSLAEWHEQLPAESFHRLDRSLIIGLDRIDRRESIAFE
jgi:hypothetical protein